MIKDIDNKTLEDGHIIAVRYVWNSYVGEVDNKVSLLRATGNFRHAFFSPHEIENKHTHQILSHIDPTHSDFNQEVNDWYNNEEPKYCPIKLRIYDNLEKGG